MAWVREGASVEEESLEGGGDIVDNFHNNSSLFIDNRITS